jgi:molecular chaperone DnaK (HSP70)
MSDLDPVVGIDLGTTNSVVAAVRDGLPRVIPVPGYRG